ncbi:MAG: hypothetical protein H8K06_12365 [Nitrospira sp.]|mgnify:CR=1 FL=1|uniref:HMA domain-containing protein n=1 Tax=Nitrospira defluvii TaxID=330214 RepID=A0ABN7LXK7_9BACT|nr:hypothetical protein [Nitrospira defluvii]MCS6327867.1 hypothetical protein [Nitrospira sp.]CAE6772722.1 conserved exported hypothetical protein [Nitrospira defluvii]
MRNPGMIGFFLVLLSGCLAIPAVAETSQERVALFLSGPDCSAQYQSIVAALTPISGVARVDPDSIPEHVLIDVSSGVVLPEELLAAARRALPSAVSCQVDIMKSCISAGPSSTQP